MTESPLRSRIPTLILAVSMFITGGCGLVSQYILSTVSTYILGNSIEQFSVIIALTLLMMGLAGVWQKQIDDRFLVEKFVATEVGLGILCGFTPLAMHWAYAELSAHFVLVQYFLILSVGFLIGLEIPLAIRINEKHSSSLKSNIASIWALDYVGSFVGALVWAFLLIRFLPLTELSFYVGMFNLLVGALTLFGFWRLGAARFGWGAALTLTASLGLLVWGVANNRPWSLALEQRLYDQPIVLSQTTKYQRIVMTRDPLLGDFRLFLNGNLQFSSLDEHIYHEFLVHPPLSLAPYRRRVLVLGGGDGLAVREILRWREVEEVVLVDIDPGMVDLGKKNPELVKLNRGSFQDARVSALVPRGREDTGRWRDVAQSDGGGDKPQSVASVRIFTIDAAQFARTTPGAFDVILVDLPDPNSIELAKLYSREFYRDLGRLLSKDGVMAVQATSPYHARETFWCVDRTLKSSGFSTVPYHENVPSFGSWGWILAGHRPPDLSRTVVAPAGTRHLSDQGFRRALVFGRDWTQASQKEVNTLMRPVILDYYLRSGWLQD
jgi:spermidine synthase